MKIRLNALGCISPEQISANIAYNKARGYRRAVAASQPIPLAVVGGGLSVRDHLDELKSWPGAIWGINHTFTWLRDHGIRSTFYTADPRPLDGLDIRPGENVLLATYSDPALFDLAGRGNISTFQHWENGVIPGVTSAGTSMCLAFSLNHWPVTFFGCESSYRDGQTHVYTEHVPDDLIRVHCNGEDFLSKLEFLNQADLLATAIRHEPGFFREKSGGLLRAIVIDPDHDIVAGSRALHDMLKGPQCAPAAC